METVLISIVTLLILALFVKEKMKSPSTRDINYPIYRE